MPIMYKRNLVCMIYSIALFILVFLSTSCQKQEARKLDEVYTIGLHSAVSIY
jgi:hypothetical protein